MKKIMLALSVVVLFSGAALAHCDSLDGPVIIIAKAALESGDVSPVLAWVQPGDEAAIKSAFSKTRDVRKLGPQAAQLADMWFFETLVRVHRAGEGAPYTGLKPAGSAEELIKALDKSVEKGDITALAGKISGHAEQSITEKFTKVMELKAMAGQSVEKGRAYVAAYVEFMHYVEGVKNAVHGGAHRGAGKEPAGEKPAHVH